MKNEYKYPNSLLGLLEAIGELIFTIVVGVPVITMWALLMFGPFILFGYLLLSICCRK